jgi:hypothetical protein
VQELCVDAKRATINCNFDPDMKQGAYDDGDCDLWGAMRDYEGEKDADL